MELPKRYDPKEAEPRWQEWWEKNSIYKFDPKNDKPIYSIDTPPPTVSGKMHIGHAFSYSQMDFIARYKQYYPDGFLSNAHMICYLNAVVLVEALEKAGPDLTRESFIQAIESIENFETGLGPPISFGPDRRFGMSAIGLMQVENGQIVRFGDWIEVGPAPEGIAEKLAQ